MGEFPAQNDVNLAPAPSLPQVRIKLLFLFVNLTDSPAADIQSDFNITINAQLKCETVKVKTQRTWNGDNNQDIPIRLTNNWLEWQACFSYKQNNK